jgi:HAD superfamily hydrolase (TIGR01459 family)
MKSIDRLREIAGDYDLFLIDQWGVVHNGHTLLPGARDTFEALRRDGKSIVLISNSSRRASVSEAALTALGIDRALYDDVVTSGEVAWRQMKERTDPFYAGLGGTCFLISWQPDSEFHEGQDFVPVETLEAASFVLLAGTQAPVAEYEDLLQAAARRRLPMVCLNRDMVSVAPDGTLIDCAGKLAARYEELGGAVRYNGKPGAEMYRASLAVAPTSSRPLAIGDSLHHDIAGANGAGIESVLVTSGIHATELGVEDGGTLSADRLDAVCTEYGARPDYAMLRMVW